MILDNLSVHKRPALHQLTHTAGCRVLFLPSHSPDFNPIEPAFAEIRAHLPHPAGRMCEGLEAAICRAIDRVSADHARNYFHHGGYRSSSQ